MQSARAHRRRQLKGPFRCSGGWHRSPRRFSACGRACNPTPEAQRDQLVRLMRWFERVPDEAIWNKVYGKRMVQDALVRLFSTSLVATRHKTDPPHRPTAARVLAVSLPVLHAKRYLTPELKEKLRVPVQDMLKYLRHKEHTHTASERPCTTHSCHTASRSTRKACSADGAGAGAFRGALQQFLAAAVDCRHQQARQQVGVDRAVCVHSCQAAGRASE